MPNTILEYDSQYTGQEIDEAVAKSKNVPDNTISELGNRVIIEQGKQLSEENFSMTDKQNLDNLIAIPTLTDAQIKERYERNTDTNVLTDSLLHKLTTVEGSLYVGIFSLLSDLVAAHPSSDIGSYAYLKDGNNPEKLVTWNGQAWVTLGAGVGGALTAGQIKALYESNADTNAFTDGEQSNITVAFNRINAMGLDATNNILMSQFPITLQTPQVLPTDPVLAKKDNTLATVASLLTVMSDLQTIVERDFIHNLDPVNPSFGMMVGKTGKAAQMSVHDMETNRLVASMEWFKATEEFMFTLFDRNTGVVKNSLAMKVDGKAYVMDRQLAFKDSVLASDGSTSLPASYAPVNPGDLVTKKILEEWKLDRPTVVSPYTATPTKAELIVAAKKLPHYSNSASFWGNDHDFYIRDNPQTKMILVKYRGLPTNVDDGNPGNFFFEKLSKAK